MNEQSYKAAQRKYAIGLGGAIVLTLLSYFAVTMQWFANASLTALFILVLAVVQLALQLIYFLHLGAEKKPRWKTVSFCFTLLMMLVVVIGSLWIMMNLNYNMGMSPEQMEEYMLKQNKKGF